MPIVHNILRVQGSSAKTAALFDFISDRRYGRGSLDLNKITPMPPWVYRKPTNLEILKKYKEENCQRGWCLRNWGIEKNILYPEESKKAYDGGSAISFKTPDSDIKELISKLSLIFKDVYIDYLWASEDIGSNVGAVQYKDGKALIEFIPAPGTRAAIEKSLDIIGARASDFGLIYDPSTGNYEYRGDFIDAR